MYENLVKYIATLEGQAKQLREDNLTSMNEWTTNQFIASKLEAIVKDLKELIE